MIVKLNLTKYTDKNTSFDIKYGTVSRKLEDELFTRTIAICYIPEIKIFFQSNKDILHFVGFAGINALPMLEVDNKNSLKSPIVIGDVILEFDEITEAVIHNYDGEVDRY